MNVCFLLLYSTLIQGFVQSIDTPISEIKIIILRFLKSGKYLWQMFYEIIFWHILYNISLYFLKSSKINLF